jgi:hypothetical protein
VATLDMTSLARRGADLRMQELRAELDALYRMFPDLRSDGQRVGRGRRATAPTQTDTDTPSLAPTRRGRRRPMTAAERKAVAERMRKYWAERRKAKK